MHAQLHTTNGIYMLLTYVVSNVHLCSVLAEVREDIRVAVSSTDMKRCLPGLCVYAKIRITSVSRVFGQK